MVKHISSLAGTKARSIGDFIYKSLAFFCVGILFEKHDNVFISKVIILRFLLNNTQVHGIVLERPSRNGSCTLSYLVLIIGINYEPQDSWVFLKANSILVVIELFLASNYTVGLVVLVLVLVTFFSLEMTIDFRLKLGPTDVVSCDNMIGMNESTSPGCVFGLMEPGDICKLTCSSVISKYKK